MVKGQFGWGKLLDATLCDRAQLGTPSRGAPQLPPFPVPPGQAVTHFQMEPAGRAPPSPAAGKPLTQQAGWEAAELSCVPASTRAWRSAFAGAPSVGCIACGYDTEHRQRWGVI